MWVAIVVVVVGIIALIAFFNESSHEGKEKSELRKKRIKEINDSLKIQDTYISENGITVSKDSKYSDFLKENYIRYIKENKLHISEEDKENIWADSLREENYRLIADDIQKKVYIFDKTDTLSVICMPYSEIIGYELLSDSQVIASGGMKRAIVGGLLAGTTGAIIGASTIEQKKTVSSLRAIIYRTSIADPQFEFILIDKDTDVRGIKYTAAIEFATEINAIIKAIISQSSKDASRPVDQSEKGITTNEDKSDSVSLERLKILKNAFENELITQEEYEKKKKELLDNL